MTTDNIVTRIDITGELSIFTAAALRQELLDAFDSGAEVYVDLSQVSEIDSAGLQLIVAARREAALRDRCLRFANPSPTVAELVEFCNLTAELGADCVAPLDGTGRTL